MQHIKRKLNISSPLLFTEDGKYWKSYEPFLDENASNVQSKPTLITRGIFHGYSMPVGGAGEELSFRIRVPFRWDGVTNPWFVAISSITGAEDIGDKYKFQLDCMASDIGSVIPDTAWDPLVHEVTVVNGTAFYAEIIQFECDAAHLVAGQNLQGKLTRIASAEPAVDNEIAIWHWCTRWLMDKMGTASIQGY